MSETVFLVPSSTGTHSDVLVAAGLADLLGGIPDAGVVRIRQVEIGFVVSVPGGVDLERLPQHPGYPFLKVKPAVAVPQGAVDVVDYQSETAKADRRKQARSAAGKRRRGRVEPEIDQAIQEDAPREDWPVLKVLRSLQGHETSRPCGDRGANTRRMACRDGSIPQRPPGRRAKWAGLEGHDRTALQAHGSQGLLAPEAGQHGSE